MSSRSQEKQPKPIETSPLLLNNQTPSNNNTMPAAKDQQQSAQQQQQQEQLHQSPTAVTPATAKGASQRQATIPPIGPVSTDLSWSYPAGLPLRDVKDENLLIFRRAVGINSDRAATFTDPESLEKGRRRAVGIYRSVIEQKKTKATTHHTLGALLYIFHFMQIILAAVLTALGPNAKLYEVPITILGAINTVIAGVLAVFKGSGMIERLSKDEVEFKKVQDWIEETESLLAVGIIGRNRKEVGVLVEVAFKKYNACFGQAYEIMSSSNVTGGGRDSKDGDSGSSSK